MIRDITIHAVLNGFEVKVGCQTVVFTDITEMLKEIKRYLKNPETVEKEYLEKALNAKHMTPVNPQPPAYYVPLPQASTQIPYVYPYISTTTAPPSTISWTTSGYSSPENITNTSSLGND